MGVKIPVVSGKDFSRHAHDDAPPHQVAEFAEYRDFMAAYCEARLWWMAETRSPDAEAALRFWSATRDRQNIYYALQLSWNRGYWPTRSELHQSTSGVSDASFARICKDAATCKMIVIESDPADKRSKIIRPTRQSVIALERATTHYFMTLADAAPPESLFGKGLRARIARIMSVDHIRKSMGFTHERAEK
uniref:Uncharacterized protein n=1 Tax=uncultured marine virus TaxID=186617 RepID=A0A0F7L3Z0_9VIRU|nr:hypothetical protein [uncultured marine virus]